MLKPRVWQSGVTLIELIATIAIVAILATTAVPSFQAMMMNGQIRSTAESILNGMQLARAQAVNLNAQVQFVLGPGSQWTVGCVTVTATCPATIQKSAIGDGASTNVTVDPTPVGATTAVFTNLGTTVTTAGYLTQLDITLPANTLPAAQTHPLRVLVGTGGGAGLCDPSFSSPDPRAC